MKKTISNAHKGSPQADPVKFKLERFDHSRTSLGFGRRVCPGRLFFTCDMLLATRMVNLLAVRRSTPSPRRIPKDAPRHLRNSSPLSSIRESFLSWATGVREYWPLLIDLTTDDDGFGCAHAV
jgi:hypothetical protein